LFASEKSIKYMFLQIIFDQKTFISKVALKILSGERAYEEYYS